MEKRRVLNTLSVHVPHSYSCLCHILYLAGHLYESVPDGRALRQLGANHQQSVQQLGQHLMGLCDTNNSIRTTALSHTRSRFTAFVINT